METIVQKFGGSSLATVDQLTAVASSVVDGWRKGQRSVVVVSAMGRTTEQLIAQARQVMPSPPQRELDMLVTAGERISMALLSMAIHRLGGDSISFTGSQCGIITDNSHQGARILEVRPTRIVDALDRGRIVIVAGYQGVSREREVTTLGRGGSDTTAVALAAALGADACEIYSDVDGVYSADPSLCPQAKHLAQVPYEVMQSMAVAGARVLNADAVAFARRAGIRILARQTGQPAGRQTVVSAEPLLERGALAVVSTEQASRVCVPSRVAHVLLEEIRAAGGRVMHLASGGGHQLELVVDRAGMPGQGIDRLSQLAISQGGQAAPVGVVTVVGNGLLANSGLWGVLDQTTDELGGGEHNRFGTALAVTLLVDVVAVRPLTLSLHGRLIGPVA